MRAGQRHTIVATSALAILVVAAFGVTMFDRARNDSTDLECWDHSTATRGGRCPLLAGLSALQWAFKPTDDNPPRCESASQRSREMFAKPTEMYICTWSDVRGDMLIMRWGSPAEAATALQALARQEKQDGFAWQVSDFTVNDDPQVVGAVYESSGVSEDEAFSYSYLRVSYYDKLGMAAWELGLGDDTDAAMADMEKMESRWTARSANEIDVALSSIR